MIARPAYQLPTVKLWKRVTRYLIVAAFSFGLFCGGLTVLVVT